MHTIKRAMMDLVRIMRETVLHLPKCSDVLTSRTVLAPVLFLLFSAGVGAGPLTIIPGVPDHDGTKMIAVTDATGVVTIVPVPVDKDEQTDKRLAAANIATALNENGLTAAPTSGNNVEVEFATRIDIKTDTGQKDKVAALFPSNSRFPWEGHLAYTGTLLGIGEAGAQATYFASVEFNDVSTEFEISYGSLPDQTLPGLLTVMFNNLLLGLPANQQSNLSLDLENNAIFFQFIGVTNPSMGSGSTDMGLFSTVSLAVVPEPGSIALVGLGLLISCSAKRRPRRADV